jgi:hypothetical protein
VQTQRANPRRGLLAGLAAFVVFASSAVGMTAGASISSIASLPQTLTAHAFVHHDDGRGDDGDGRHR